jgi:lysozyme
MKLGPKGKALMHEFEGCKLEAYPDPGTGSDPWTIGYGHTSMAGEPHVKKGMTITKEEADEIFARDLSKYEKHVPEATQNRFDAMVSLCYNIGPGNFNKSSVKRHHLTGEFSKAAHAFLAWNKANGKVMKGLTRRREAEKELYLMEDVI